MERALYAPLISALLMRDRIGTRTLLVEELYLHGRRVDLACLTRQGVTVAYEFKVTASQRVLEQAWYNALAFDRSWIVLARLPGADFRTRATSNGIGIYVVGEFTRKLQEGKLQNVQPLVRQRVIDLVRSRGVLVEDYVSEL